MAVRFGLVCGSNHSFLILDHKKQGAAMISRPIN